MFSYWESSSISQLQNSLNIMWGRPSILRQILQPVFMGDWIYSKMGPIHAYILDQAYLWMESSRVTKNDMHDALVTVCLYIFLTMESEVCSACCHRCILCCISGLDKVTYIVVPFGGLVSSIRLKSLKCSHSKAWKLLLKERKFN